MDEIYQTVIGVQTAAIVILGWWVWRLRKHPPRQEAYDVQCLLTDLLRGQALVKVERLAPADVLLRSPRGRG